MPKHNKGGGGSGNKSVMGKYSHSAVLRKKGSSMIGGKGGKNPANGGGKGGRKKMCT